MKTTYDYRSKPHEELIKGPTKMRILINKTKDFAQNYWHLVLFSIIGLSVVFSLFILFYRSTTGTVPNYFYIEYVDNNSGYNLYQIRGNVNWGWDPILMEVGVNDTNPQGSKELAIQYARESCFIK